MDFFSVAIIVGSAVKKTEAENRSGWNFSKFQTSLLFRSIFGFFIFDFLLFIFFFVRLFYSTGRQTYHRYQSETVYFLFCFRLFWIFACALQIIVKWVVYNGVYVGMRWKRLYVQFRLAKGLTLRLLNHQHPFRINSEYHLEHRQSIGKNTIQLVHWISSIPIPKMYIFLSLCQWEPILTAKNESWI